MNVTRITRKGKARYVVRWREGGRGTPYRQRTFDMRSDAVRFETAVRPGTLETYAVVLDKWIVPRLAAFRLRELSREKIDSFRLSMSADGAGAPTVNRCLGNVQGILQRAVEWNRCAGPVTRVPGAS